MAEAAENLAPHTGVLSLSKPLAVSDAVKLASPVIGTIVNWFSMGSKEALTKHPFT